MMMNNVWKLIGLLGLSWFLVGCGGQVAETAPSAGSGQTGKAAQITCTAAYRSSPEVGIEQEETFKFTDMDDELWGTFGELMFHAAYDAGGADNERNLRVWVTDAAETAVYHSTLYQLPLDGGPQNQFVGGHGFTGLSYSYAPDSTAELQYWCAAE
jgi:hypothetical protein